MITFIPMDRFTGQVLAMRAVLRDVGVWIV